MDPDEAVRRLRALSAQIDTFDQNPMAAGESLTELNDLAEEMCQVWDGLDAWLSSGGVAPRVWAKPLQERIVRRVLEDRFGETSDDAVALVMGELDKESRD